MTDIERLRMELAAAIGITRRLTAEVERLQAEVAEWRERWAAERRDHETTIRHFNNLMNEA